MKYKVIKSIHPDDLQNKLNQSEIDGYDFLSEAGGMVIMVKKPDVEAVAEEVWNKSYVKPTPEPEPTPKVARGKDIQTRSEEMNL